MTWTSQETRDDLVIGLLSYSELIS